MNNKRTWLILGGTSAVGRAFAREAAKRGDDILFLGKENDDLELAVLDIRARYPSIDVARHELDTSNLDSFAKTVEECEQKAQNVISVFSALETAYTQKECGKDLGKIKNMFQINYLSQVYFLSAVAPVMQKQGCGEILVLGSTAGEYGRSDNYAYGSTKAALHVWLQGFHDQMAESGVSVTTVKIDDLDSVGERKNVSRWMPIDLEACARACMDYSRRKARVRYFPWYSSVTVVLRHFIPEDIFDRLKK